MKEYGELSDRSKLRRLKAIAVEALARYGVKTQRLTFHGYDTNLLYRVTDDSGNRYILRLATPGWRTLEGLRGEAMWLDALRSDTDIVAPRIVRAPEGSAVLQIGAKGVPDLWNTTLMTWIPGRLLGHFLVPDNLEKMGILFAKLHIHGGSWSPPETFPSAVFSHYISRGEPDRLFGNEHTGLYSDSERKVLEEMRDRVVAEYSSLDRDDLRVIHCDLWHDNIKLHRGTLIPFDFEDTIIGFRLHDIAMAMLDLLEDTDDTRYPLLLESFRSGYESLLPWPDGCMETLQIGRLLWIMNWAAQYGGERLKKSVQYHTPILTHFSNTGVISFPRKS